LSRQQQWWRGLLQVCLLLLLLALNRKSKLYFIVPCTAKLVLAFSCDGYTSLAAAAALLHLLPEP